MTTSEQYTHTHHRRHNTISLPRQINAEKMDHITPKPNRCYIVCPLKLNSTAQNRASEMCGHIAFSR